MNIELIKHYEKGVELITKDINKIKDKIRNKTLCDSIEEIAKINKYEGYIIELEESIKKLKL